MGLSDFKVLPGGKAARGSKVWADKHRKRAKEIAKDLEVGYMELAQILYELFDVPVDDEPHKNSWLQEWGYKGIGEFAQEELGLYRRKAEHLRAIWFRLEVELKDMDPALKKRIIALGWSKVRELVRVLSLRNAKKWVELAEGLSWQDLFNSIRDYQKQKEAAEHAKAAGEKVKMPTPQKVNKAAADADDDLPTSFDDTEKEAPANLPKPMANPEKSVAPVKVEEPEPEPEPEEDDGPPPKSPDEKTFQKRFVLYPDQATLVDAALKRAQEMTNSIYDGHNLTVICQDFLATNDFGKGDIKQLLKFFVKYEKLFGVKLVVVDQDAEMLYGLDTLETLQKKYQPKGTK